MEKDRIESMLRSILDEEDAQIDPPSLSDWYSLEGKFGCIFSEEFKAFIGLMAKYSFPGEILNVSSGETNGNDSISFTYDFELDQGTWNADMIPFYSIGNGDYFCLSISESPNSRVYYYYHENIRFEQYSDNFDIWLRDLPEFLS